MRKLGAEPRYGSHLETKRLQASRLKAPAFLASLHLLHRRAKVDRVHSCTGSARILPRVGSYADLCEIAAEYVAPVALTIHPTLHRALRLTRGSRSNRDVLGAGSPLVAVALYPLTGALVAS